MTSHKVPALLILIITVVTYDLRSPSMLHGKKGFDRLVYAAKKVLNQPLVWFFCNIGKSGKFSPPSFDRKI